MRGSLHRSVLSICSKGVLISRRTFLMLSYLWQRLLLDGLVLYFRARGASELIQSLSANAPEFKAPRQRLLAEVEIARLLGHEPI